MTIDAERMPFEIRYKHFATIDPGHTVRVRAELNIEFLIRTLYNKLCGIEIKMASVDEQAERKVTDRKRHFQRTTAQK